MKKYIIIPAVLLAGALALFFYKRQNYEVTQPHKGEVVEAVYGLGKVKSHQRFDVIVGLMTIVQHVYVEEGDPVKKGQPLIQFDSGAVFKAPFDGTVTLIKMRKGEIAIPHVALLRIENIQNRYIELSLEQEAALRIRKGQEAKVSFESVRGKNLRGEVTAVFPREDEFLAHVDVPELEASVLPGMTADVTVEIGKNMDVLLIPFKAVNNGMVTVERNGKWIKEKVDLGHFDGTFVEVKGDSLKLQDKIRIPKGE